MRAAVPTRPRLLFSAFNEFVVSHHDHGLWRHPASRQLDVNDVDHWVDLARTLERGNFDLLFFADVLAPYDLFGGNRDAAVRTGMQTPVNDPVVLAPVLAYATEHIGIAVTSNVLQTHPYAFARTMSTLDHVTRGRIAWNIVTSFLPGAGRNLGFGGLPTHEERYGRAEEYMQVVYRLWEASWDDDAVVADRARGIYADPSRVRTIDHVGEHYDVVGPHLTSPSPQRTPVLFNAAASDVGIAFAGRHAEVLFTELAHGDVAENVRKLRAAAVAHGRAPGDVRIFGSFGCVVGSTEEEAHRLHRELLELQDLDSIRVKLSGFWQHDLATVDLRATAADLLDDGVGSATMRRVLAAVPDRDWRFEQVLRWVVNQRTVGTPEQVADAIEHWHDLGVDGLNITYLVSPGSYEDFVDHVSPVLVERGLMQPAHRSGTLREKVFGRGPHLPDAHPARRLRPGVALQEQS